jgi:hypothetical protein
MTHRPIQFAGANKMSLAMKKADEIIKKGHVRLRHTRFNGERYLTTYSLQEICCHLDAGNFSFNPIFHSYFYEKENKQKF